MGLQFLSFVVAFFVFCFVCVFPLWGYKGVLLVRTVSLPFRNYGLEISSFLSLRFSLFAFCHIVLTYLVFPVIDPFTSILPRNSLTDLITGCLYCYCFWPGIHDFFFFFFQYTLFSYNSFDVLLLTVVDI